MPLLKEGAEYKTWWCLGMWSSLLQLDLLILVSYWEEVEQPRGTSRYPKMCCTGQCLGAKTPLHVAWIHLGSMVYMLFPNVSQKNISDKSIV